MTRYHYYGLLCDKECMYNRARNWAEGNSKLGIIGITKQTSACIDLHIQYPAKDPLGKMNHLRLPVATLQKGSESNIFLRDSESNQHNSYTLQSVPPATISNT